MAKSNVKKVIGVVSGKGGVGKSIVSSMLSVLANRRGLKTAILDSDATGPSIPKAFGIKEKAHGTQTDLYPCISKEGIKMMSINLLLENETDPVLWRGPIISGTIQQFWTDVVWGDVDVMFIDMPPGTGDIALTVFQSIPLDGIIIVATPQELVSMIVEKAVKMANQMSINILGLVENMSYLQCPHCDEKIEMYGSSKVEEIAQKHGVKTFSKIPIIPELTKLIDSGEIEKFQGDWLDNMIDMVINLKKYENKVFRL